MATRGLTDEEIEDDLISMGLREHTRKRKHSSASSAQIARNRPPPGANTHAIEGSDRPVLRSSKYLSLRSMSHCMRIAHIMSSSAAVAQPALTFNNVPLGALDPKQPFKLNQPRPLGIQVPVDAAATSYEWKSYDRTSIDWSSKAELLRLNEWRTRATRARGKKLKAYTDGRRKEA
ncbi:unnamed protein product [Aureobasidium pullulans]|nr:unnamed protein product [Aureobasidium pullulans]